MIQRVDTLDDIDKWTPFNHLVKHLPFYRIVGMMTHIFTSHRSRGDCSARHIVSQTLGLGRGVATLFSMSLPYDVIPPFGVRW